MPTIRANNSVLGVDYTNIDGCGRIAIKNETVPTNESDELYEDGPEQEEDEALNTATTLHFRNYADIGPNNEIYLKQGTGIAFKVIATGALVTTFDVEAKSIGGETASLNISVGTTSPTSLSTTDGTDIKTSTYRYYSMGIPQSDWAI